MLKAEFQFSIFETIFSYDVLLNNSMSKTSGAVPLFYCSYTDVTLFGIVDIDSKFFGALHLYEELELF